MIQVPLPMSLMSFHRQGNGLVAPPAFVFSVWGWGGVGWPGPGPVPHPSCGILGAGECLPPPLHSSPALLWQPGDGVISRGSPWKRQWEEAASAPCNTSCLAKCRVAVAACPWLNGVWASAGTFSAPHGSQTGSLGPREASECDPATGTAHLSLQGSFTGDQDLPGTPRPGLA